MTNANDDMMSGLDDEAMPVKKGYKKIFIDESSDPSELSFVFVGVNGRAYQIKRGVEVVVPEDIVTVLQDARVEKKVEEEDGSFVIRSYLRFPFRVLA